MLTENGSTGGYYNEASEQGHPLKIYTIGMSLYTRENAKIVQCCSNTNLFYMYNPLLGTLW